MGDDLKTTQINTVQIKLEAYEGPLDLLLKLIERHEVDIYSVPIALLADQYLYHLEQLLLDSNADAEANADIGMRSISEFLVLAAQLVEIKSRLLLPAAEKGADAGDPRDALARRLADYKQCKALSEALKRQAAEGERFIFRDGEEDAFRIFKLSKPSDRDPEQEISALLNGLTLEDFHRIFADALDRRELAVDKVRSGFDSVRLDMYTIEDKIEFIKRMLVTGGRLSFGALIPERSPKEERLMTFLAVLELARQRELFIEQDDIFGEIRINREAF